MQDKENAPINLVHRLDDRATHGKAGKQAHAHAQPKVSSKRSGGSFGRLLSEATTELRTSSDFKVAHDSQRKEAAEMTREWVQEASDRRLALNVEENLKAEEKEEKEVMNRNTKAGEAAALNAALEERRGQKQRAEAKKQQEAADAEAAKRSILDDIDQHYEQEKACEQDEERAKELYRVLQDEMVAEELQRREERENEEYVIRMQSIVDADARLAQEEQARIEDEMAEEHARLDVADQDLARIEHNKEVLALLKERKQREAEGARMARRLARVAQREQHRTNKAHDKGDLIASFIGRPASVSEQWEDVEAEIEDVAGGICITVLLPQMISLNVSLGVRNNVQIDARRMLSPGEENLPKDSDACRFYAEFIIDGAKKKITDNWLSHEYSSETGMVHVYIDHVHLEQPAERDHEGTAATRPSLIKRLTSGFRKMKGLRKSDRKGRQPIAPDTKV